MTKNMQKTKNIIHFMAKLGTTLYISFLILEFLKSGVVTNYIDINLFLAGLIALWIVDYYLGKRDSV